MHPCRIGCCMHEPEPRTRTRARRLPKIRGVDSRKTSWKTWKTCSRKIQQAPYISPSILVDVTEQASLSFCNSCNDSCMPPCFEDKTSTRYFGSNSGDAWQTPGRLVLADTPTHRHSHIHIHIHIHSHRRTTDSKAHSVKYKEEIHALNCP